MKHYLILKFKEGDFSPDVAREIERILAPLAGEPGISGVAVRENCVERGDNHDLMVEIVMDGVLALENYLAHPCHAELVRFAGPKAASKVTFDCLYS
jgi:hypothetical protein